MEDSDSLPTVQLLVEWLDYLLEHKNDPIVVFSHHMDTHVPQWVHREYGRRHNAATYDRKWRLLRSEERQRLHAANIVVREVPSDLNPKDSEKAWQITRNTPGSNSASAASATEAHASG